MSNFFHSLLINRPIIDRGNYVLVVDACWDPCVELDPKYDDVLVRVYCSKKMTLERLDQNLGEAALASALKKVASLVKNSEYRSFYRAKDTEFGNKIYRISDPATNVGYYGFCYRKNDSLYTSTEKLTLKLTGLKFVGLVDDDFIEIESGQDHIFVMRNIEAFGSTGYGMSLAMKSRPMSDAEIIQKTRNAESKTLTGDIEYQMMLCEQGGAIVFSNNDTSGKKITVDIEGSSNLRIEDGDTFLKKAITVHGGSKGSVILRLLQNNGNPSLACSFQC